MGEIIKVDINKVLVGCEDGSVIDVNLSDVNFIPEIGDKVKVYKSDDSYYIVKKNEEDLKDENWDKSYQKEEKNENVSKKYEESPQNITNNYYLDQFKGKRVHKIAYVLLAFFLGGLGVHKFYAGKIGKGFLYLIFSWTTIPEIIGIVEAIHTIFTKKADEYGCIYL